MISRRETPRFREAVAGYLNRECGWKLTREHIGVTSGGQTAFFLLLNRFAGTLPDGSRRRVLLPVVPEYIGYSDQGVAGSLFQSADRASTPGRSGIQIPR
ncbi:MAG: hypothetical protein R3F31_18250 [Verrucomicrobiales bacterium]